MVSTGFLTFLVCFCLASCTIAQIVKTYDAKIDFKSLQDYLRWPRTFSSDKDSNSDSDTISKNGYSPGQQRDSHPFGQIGDSYRAARASNRTCYGDILGLRPTGKFDTGVPGSQLEVKLDLRELEKRWSFYQDVADANCIQASVIAGIASRESRGGLDLYKTWGFADHGHAYGIMQCNLAHSGLGLGCVSCFWDSKCHIQMLVSKILVPYIQQVHKKFPSWTRDQSIQGGVAAYNKGVRHVISWPDVDKGTTHNDYSNDALARAQYLYKLGWN